MTNGHLDFLKFVEDCCRGNPNQYRVACFSFDRPGPVKARFKTNWVDKNLYITDTFTNSVFSINTKPNDSESDGEHGIRGWPSEGDK
jgi:hypothetical protein